MTRDEAQVIIDRVDTKLFGGRVRFDELNLTAQAELRAAMDVLGCWRLAGDPKHDADCMCSQCDDGPSWA